MPPDAPALLIDVGNTRVKCYSLTAFELEPARVDAIALSDATWLPKLDALLASQPWSSLWIANVAPAAVLERVLTTCRARLPGIVPRIARTHARMGGVQIAYAKPQDFGVDRFLGLIAAHSRWPHRPALVVSIGSAVTIDLIDADGMHAGGVIAPAPGAMDATLARVNARLTASGRAPTRSLARQTNHAVANGCALAVVGLIELCERMHAASDQTPVRVLTGGGASVIAPLLEGDSVMLPALVAIGLARYAQCVDTQAAG